MKFPWSELSNVVAPYHMRLISDRVGSHIQWIRLDGRMFAIVSYAGYIYLANSRFRIVEIFDSEEHATKALGVPIINMSTVKRRSSIYELLYHYFDLPSDSRKIMQCAPWIDRDYLVRRPVRLLGVFTNNGEFPEISRPADRIFRICDSTGTSYFNVFESLLMDRHTYPEYKWSEPDPIQINKGGYDTSTRILYYPKLGEFWDHRQLIGYYDKKLNTKEQEKKLIESLTKQNHADTQSRRKEVSLIHLQNYGRIT